MSDISENKRLSRQLANEKASYQLGMKPRTASHKLLREVIFSLLLETNRDKCYRCNTQLTSENFSLEHIQDWLDSDYPFETFFDVSNIEFVCKTCNSRYNRGRFDVRTSGASLVKPEARPFKPLVSSEIQSPPPQPPASAFNRDDYLITSDGEIHGYVSDKERSANQSPRGDTDQIDKTAARDLRHTDVFSRYACTVLRRLFFDTAPAV